MKIYLDSIGCRLNQSEIERYGLQFRAAGHSLVATAGEADMVVVNTCAVTGEASSDSRQKIRQAVKAGAGQVVVTGCWSTLNAHAAAAIEGVTQVVSNQRKDDLVREVLQLAPESFDLEPLAREPLPGIHLRTRAFIKTQDGCDYHCTFCVTRLARGRSISRPVAEIIADIRSALSGGAQEVVLTGVALGSWGHEGSPRTDLTHLIRAILDTTGVQRLRLSSIEPWDLDEAFFELWRDPRLCQHLHMPLQSGCAATLRRMGRRTTPDAYAALASMARSVSPGLALTTDMIVGFPGETEGEFQESLEFVDQIGFASGHVFTFSSRPGTAAAHLPDQVPPVVRKQRNARLRSIFASSGASYRRDSLGAISSVLWEATDRLGPDGWRVSGLTGNYLRVYATSPVPMWNQLSSVRLVREVQDGLEGEILGVPPSTR